MGFTIDGQEIATTESGYLESMEDWSRELAGLIAAEESLELSERHWDVINYLRDEYINKGVFSITVDCSHVTGSLMLKHG